MQTSCAMAVAQEVQQQVEHLWKCVCMNAFQLMNETCCIKSFECSSRKVPVHLQFILYYSRQSALPNIAHSQPSWWSTGTTAQHFGLCLQSKRKLASSGLHHGRLPRVSANTTAWFTTRAAEGQNYRVVKKKNNISGLSFMLDKHKARVAFTFW